MFAGFPLGIGVANIKPLLPLMAHLPAYVTDGEGGHGFAEFATKLLAAKAGA
jgi:hydroxymethylpyrimidine pyrophosphatase-like HAD family hydrolase